MSRGPTPLKNKIAEKSFGTTSDVIYVNLYPCQLVPLIDANHHYMSNRTKVISFRRIMNVCIVLFMYYIILLGHVQLAIKFSLMISSCK